MFETLKRGGLISLVCTLLTTSTCLCANHLAGHLSIAFVARQFAKRVTPLAPLRSDNLAMIISDLHTFRLSASSIDK